MLNHATRRVYDRLGERLSHWLLWWPLRPDDQWEKYGDESLKLSVRPSEYSRCQCHTGADVSEKLLHVVIDDIGDDNIVMSVDYPHADGPFPHGLATFLALAGVGADSKRKIMWDNCLRLYGFSENAPIAGTED
jgi:predicted TIM-barrel fold metal-dependent hydrolase